MKTLITEVTSNELSEFLSNSKRVLLVEFFTREGTGSYLIELSLTEAQNEFSNDLEIYKINIEKNAQLAEEYKLFSFPSLVFFKEGKMIDILTGAIPKKLLLNKISEVLKQKDKTTI